ncbi:MAG TPA: hypothetical protein VG939_13125 [Caulobacteraceae bacterium]|nr:hypothetical protein [Caulobacteraceae bacterium]
MRTLDSFLFAAASGAAFRVSFALEAVVSLRHNEVAARRIARTVRSEDTGEVLAAPQLARLADEDVHAIDGATFDCARKVLEGAHPGAIVITPASFGVLATRKGRRRLSDGVGERLKGGVMVEFADVERGTPVSRLTDVSGLTASLCRGVLVRLAPARDIVAPVRGYRPHGVSLDAVQIDGDDSAIADQVLAFGDQAKGAAPTTMVFGLPNDGFFSVALVAGVTHASARADLDQVRSAA